MMKKLLVFLLVLGLASGADAALTLVGAPSEPITVGQTATITVHSSTTGGYAGWLEIEDPAVVDFSGAPQFTPAGDTAGSSTMTDWSAFGAWYEFTVASTDPTKPILAGDHILVNVIGVGEGLTKLNLYASDGVKLLESVSVSVVPEPATIVLLGLGGLLLRRRK
jgi:hypothetical protein